MIDRVGSHGAQTAPAKRFFLLFQELAKAKEKGKPVSLRLKEEASLPPRPLEYIWKDRLELREYYRNLWRRWNRSLGKEGRTEEGVVEKACFEPVV
jgi:hypothetical protein